MPESERQRPGASLVQSHVEKVRELLASARDLNHQLANLGTAEEEKASSLRGQLCEVISDLTITDPAVADEHDLATMLWRSCFYVPICSFRKQISKAKRKKGGSPPRTLETQFKRFLEEALQLYNYLSVQFQSKLVPPGLTQGNSSQDMSTQASDLPREPVSTKGVVKGLYRLFIYTGDLHRYAESYDRASKCYLNAAKLSPGNGNPYNQMAVVSQMKDPNLSLNALYYYCRSLLGTHSRFDTSTINLERLFTGNREHLQEHSRGPPAVYTHDKKNPLANAQKQATIKSCLSHFVDFHFDILQPNVEIANLRAKMEGIFKSLESLLQASAFSDQLLFRLVIITTFSLEKRKADTSRQILGEFMLQLGETLASRLVSNLEKVLDKMEGNSRQQQPVSIRLLLPLLVLGQYMAHQSLNLPLEQSEKFWEGMASVGTLCRKYNLYLEPSLLDDDCMEPEEFQTLKGYHPYKFLKPEYIEEGPYVDDNEAVLVLDLQGTQTQKADTKADETFFRLAAFVRLCDFCCSSDEILLQFDGSKYEYSPSQNAHNSSPSATEQVMEVEPDDDGGDFVVGASPEAILPIGSSVSLKLKSPMEVPEGNSDRSPDAHTTNEKKTPPPTVVMPPPGFSFGGAPQMQSGLQNPLANSSTVPAAGLAFPVQNHGHPVPPLGGMGNHLPPLTNSFLQENKTGVGAPTSHYSQFMTPAYQQQNDIFSELLLPTQNPFVYNNNVSYPPPAYNQTNPPWQQSPQDAFPVTDMLGSGLLESLLMAESSNTETKNPFA